MHHITYWTSGSNTMDMTSYNQVSHQKLLDTPFPLWVEELGTRQLHASLSTPSPFSLPLLSLPQVALLKDVLEEWKKEVDKKPPEMSVDQAYDALGLQTGVGGSVHIYTDLISIVVQG